MKRSQLQRKTLLQARIDLKRSNTRLLSKTSLKRQKLIKKTLNTPQAILDKIFSEYIRRKCSGGGVAKCATCPSIQNWQSMDCGHFRSRGHLATRYHEGNVWIQCRDCNRFNDGKYEEFADFLERTYGQEHVRMIIMLSDTIVHNFLYEEKIREYSDKLIALIKYQDNVIQY